jgi:hypothetical protein
MAIEEPAASHRSVTRITVYLPNLVWDVLGAVAAEQCVTKTEGLRRAISLYKLIHEVRQDGAQIRLDYPGGRSEIVHIAY